MSRSRTWWLLPLLLLPAVALGDDDDDEEEEEVSAFARSLAPVSATPVDPVYLRECGACHVAYPAALLPARSWRAVLDGLPTHFGDDASLPPEAFAAVRDWLVPRAADTGGSVAAARRVAGLAPDAAPLRITELRWFRGEHDEIPTAWVTGNPEVRSFSACAACHGTGAAAGRFDEHTVRIPGHGAWDD